MLIMDYDIYFLIHLMVLKVEVRILVNFRSMAISISYEYKCTITD